MTRIATATEDSQILFFLQQNKNQLDNLTEEVSSGTAAQTYAGIAPQAENLVRLKGDVQQQQDFNATIDTVTSRLQSADLSLQQIASQVQAFRQLLPNAAFTPPPKTSTSPSIQSQASVLLQEVAGFLNVQDGSRYLFAGTKTNTAPVDLTKLPTSSPNINTPVNGPGGYYQGGPNTAPAQVAPGISVNYGITADNSAAFEPIIRTLNFLANTPSFSSGNPADIANLSQAGALLDSALTSLTTIQGNLGLQQQQLKSESDLHAATISVDENDIGKIQNIDQATVITQLNSLDTQLQASYAATSQLEKMSLVTFLGGTAG